MGAALSQAFKTKSKDYILQYFHCWKTERAFSGSRFSSQKYVSKSCKIPCETRKCDEKNEGKKLLSGFRK